MRLLSDIRAIAAYSSKNQRLLTYETKNLLIALGHPKLHLCIPENASCTLFLAPMITGSNSACYPYASTNVTG